MAHTLLTPKARAALQDAVDNNGHIFQTELCLKHHPTVLSRLVKAGLLMRAKVNTIWLITDAGRETLRS